MPSIVPSERDQRYFEILAASLRVCATYKPKFGKAGAEGMSRVQFQRLYGDDPFYRWVGLDSALMYAAHKAAGGMTSIYRQLGIGGERLFRQAIIDELGLSGDQARWTYTIPGQGDKDRKLELDARIVIGDIQSSDKRARVETWIEDSAKYLGVAPALAEQLTGVVFEVRQGYKSADAKRQNADVGNAASAYTNLYMPSIALLSTQINHAVATRYVAARWLLLTGTTDGSPTDSVYVFCRDVLGYDLAAFFERNSGRFRTLLEDVVAELLSPDPEEVE